MFEPDLTDLTDIVAEEEVEEPVEDPETEEEDPETEEDEPVEEEDGEEPFVSGTVRPDDEETKAAFKKLPKDVRGPIEAHMKQVDEMMDHWYTEAQLADRIEEQFPEMLQTVVDKVADALKNTGAALKPADLRKMIAEVAFKPYAEFHNMNQQVVDRKMLGVVDNALTRAGIKGAKLEKDNSDLLGMMLGAVSRVEPMKRAKIARLMAEFVKTHASKSNSKPPASRVIKKGKPTKSLSNGVGIDFSTLDADRKG